ncbi:MAG: hypothetical protein DMG76_37800 [Acidobacteria bacterium]|nr:MAG: hypothetical protein DMG76_37800 [Acidobacteriota bacterium]
MDLGLGDGLQRTTVLYKVNEHGPALKVFWSRCGGMGVAERRKDKDPEAFNKRKEREDKNKKSFWVLWT